MRLRSKTKNEPENLNKMSSVISRYNVRNIALLALCIGSLLMLLFALGPQGIVPAHGMMSTNTIESSFENLNLRSSALPVPNVNGGQAAPGVSIATKTIQIMGTDVFYRIAEPGDISTATGKILFLLHGAAFSSKTWQFEIGTIQTMASIGHKVIAVDLPGYGQSGRFSGDRGEFLQMLIQTLAPEAKPVLVSPSMSGTFSLPLLDRNQDLLCGYIPVAPVATTSYPTSFYQAIQVPTMIVYGDKDTGLGVTSANRLSEIPKATKPQVLLNSRHPCYLDQPEVFHTLIYNFMLHLSC